MGVDRWRVLAGFAAATIVLAILVGVVGVEGLLAAFVQADLGVLPVVVGVAVVWLSAWGLALRVILGALAVRIAPTTAVFVYTGALFANNVTPFGQAGGEPVTALLLTQVTDADFETSFAAITSADAMNLFPSIAFALVGLAWLSIVATLGPQLRAAAVGIGVFAIAVVLLVSLIWRTRRRVKRVLVRVVAPLARALGGVLPRVSAPSRDDVERRIRNFVRSIEIVATDRHRLAWALGFSALGWFAQVCSLWLSLYAVGVTAPAPAVLLAVPLGAFAGATVLPGGLGGIEAVLVAVLVPTVGAPAATVLAAVLLHRGAIYWLPTLAGAGVVTAIGIESIELA